MFSKRVKKLRSLGVKILSFTKKKSKKVFKKPGEHSSKKKRRGISTQSLYGNLLKDKKYIQFTYYLKDYQLKKYLVECFKNKKNVCLNLFDLLECRLDNVVFRSGLAKTIPMARQLINHGNIFVNRLKILTPSFRCKPQDSIESKFIYNKKINNEFVTTKDRIKFILNYPSNTFLYSPFIENKLKRTIEFYNK